MQIVQELKDFFQEKLLKWHPTITRELPWKADRDPYKIWLSEIILQQTRVEQGMPYYLKFVEQYPTIQDLAAAPEDDVFKLWQGLGYYSRARNLHTTAKIVTNDYGGQFPQDFKAIKALKGIGDYTASAIASFAFDMPHAVVDGNVYRVLSRFFGISLGIDTTEGKKFFAKLAQELLPTDKAAIYNQAIMDFGAVHCKPKQPLCSKCLHKENCVAFNTEKISQFPVKTKKLKKKSRFFYYLVLNAQDKIVLRKRTAKDIWQNLYDFPLIETDKLVNIQELIQDERWVSFWKQHNYTIQSSSTLYQQTLSHQKIHAIFIELDVNESFLSENDAWVVLERKKMQSFAFPKIVSSYIDAPKYELGL